jgi:hypothetical protein
MSALCDRRWSRAKSRLKALSAEIATTSRLERTFATATLMPWIKGFASITRQLFVRGTPSHSVTQGDRNEHFCRNSVATSMAPQAPLYHNDISLWLLYKWMHV